MKKLCLVLALALLFAAFPAFAQGEELVGNWICVLFVNEEGAMDDEAMMALMGVPLSAVMQINIAGDGTFVITSMGEVLEGTWELTEGGVDMTVDGETISGYLTQEGQLFLAEEGSDEYGMYFEIGEAAPGVDLTGYEWNGEYVGYWEAVGIDMGGIISDSMLGSFIGDMLQIELSEDGTAVCLQWFYSVKGTWSEVEGGVSVVLDGEETIYLIDEELGLLTQTDDEAGMVYYLAQMEGAIDPSTLFSE